jgi:peptidoglycan/xylan/chitin deacetylase (PgdA/CDA1 family)
LRTLSERRARWEITTCRDLLEERLRKPIRHFSFPFGSSREVGPREIRLAREAGYATATTTRLGNVFEEHRHHLHALPRLYHATFSALATTGLVTGLLPARRSHGRRIVTT